MRPHSLRSLSRRAFLSRAGLASTALFVPGLTTGTLRRFRNGAVRVTGRVASGGRGVAGIRVSDGRQVALTDPDGAYELVADSSSQYVWISVPDGHRIPMSDSGTANFYSTLPHNGDEAEISFALERADPAENHAFLLLADPQTQDDYEINRLHDETVPDIQQTIAGLGVDDVFGVSCGDIMYDNLSLYPRYLEAVQKMGAPFFQVVGNHDLDHLPTDEASVTTFGQYFGPRYYSFDRGQVHYVVLDDVFWFGNGYIGYIDASQLQWLERDLSTVEPGSTVIVFAHIPLLSTQFRRFGKTTPGQATSVSNRDEVYRLLEPFAAHVMSGHTHEQEHVFEGGVHEHVHGAVCGAWWSDDICFDGTPNGYGVYEARGSEILWRYKSTGQPFGHQIRAYEAGSDPAAPDEIVANVWGWDPEWSVFWYVDGERKGMMSRRTGTDPLSEHLYRGPDLPSHRPWVDPVPTSHLFYCPASRPGRAVMIEAIDQAGNTFTASVPQG